MPRVKPLAQDPREAAVLAELGATLAAMKVNKQELALRSGINPSTFKNRMRNVGSMRLSELWAIRDARRRAGVQLEGEEK